MRNYYENRTVTAPFTVRKVKGWSDHIEDHLERSSLPFIKEYLNKQGFVPASYCVWKLALFSKHINIIRK